MASANGNTELCIQINNIWRSYSCKRVTYTETSEFFTYEFILNGLASDIKINSRVTAIEIWNFIKVKPIVSISKIDGFISEISTNASGLQTETCVSLQIKPGYDVMTSSYSPNQSEPTQKETNATTSMGPDTSQYEMNKKWGFSEKALDNLLDSDTDGYKTTGYFSSFIKPKETKITKVEVPIPTTELLAINVRRSIKIEP